MRIHVRSAVLVAAASVLAAGATFVAGLSPRAAWADGEPAAAPKPLSEGDEAPDFTLKDQDGKDVSLASYRGKKNVVIAFYPRAFTPGCTKEMTCFTSEWRKIEDRGAQVLALSGDPVTKLREFATAIGTRFPLLSDAGLAVAKRYGVFTASPDGGFAARSIFLVDREGKLRWVQRDFAAPVKLEGNDLLAKLDLIKPAGSDPTEPLANLASPEKEAKTLLVRYVQALLAEDVRAVDRLMHKQFGWKPGIMDAMMQQRRDGELDRVRKLFEAQDLKAIAFADVVDPRDGRVLAKGDHEKPGVLAGYSEEAKKLCAALPEGDLLLVARTKALKVGDAPLLPRELFATLRKDGDAWKILNLAGK